MIGANRQIWLTRDTRSSAMMTGKYVRSGDGADAGLPGAALHRLVGAGAQPPYRMEDRCWPPPVLRFHFGVPSACNRLRAVTGEIQSIRAGLMAKW